MEWDLGLQGVGALVALSLAFGTLAGLLVGDGVAHRLDALTVTALACLVVGLVVSEVLLAGRSAAVQSAPDGLARNGVLLAGAVTTAVVVVVMRRMAHRGAPRPRRRTAGGRRA